MKTSNWMKKQASFYTSHSDNIGRPASFNEILKCSFGSNMKEIIALRKLDLNDPEFKIKAAPLKAKLQAFTPAALLKTKASGKVEVIERTGIMQLDFDYKEIKDFDIEELKQAVFSLPFIGFCGLSCSGKGFYALALIEEPDRLSEYAEHTFEILKYYGVNPDESKGKKVENLRYISYDGNMLFRENPEPLKISNFRRKEPVKPANQYKPFNYQIKSNDALVKTQLQEIQKLQVGQRWENIQRISFTLGGLGKPELLNEIQAAINFNSAFTGEERKYMDCANVCFNEGSQKPLITI